VTFETGSESDFPKWCRHEFSTATKTATETTWPTPFRQLKGFGYHIINADEVFGTHNAHL
jgi:hypothetical protein